MELTFLAYFIKELMKCNCFTGFIFYLKLSHQKQLNNSVFFLLLYVWFFVFYVKFLLYIAHFGVTTCSPSNALGAWPREESKSFFVSGCTVRNGRKWYNMIRGNQIHWKRRKRNQECWQGSTIKMQIYFLFTLGDKVLIILRFMILMYKVTGK